MKCPICGKDINYVSTRSDVLAVDPDVVTVYTDNGRCVEGRVRHECIRERQQNCEVQDKGDS